jgi:hypothetical protein
LERKPLDGRFDFLNRAHACNYAASETSRQPCFACDP